MARRSLIIVMLALALVSCAREGPPPSSAAMPTAPPSTNDPNVADEALPTDEERALGATVPELPRECRELITSYERCIEDHMPESGRELLREALAKSREQWQQAAIDATTEATRAQLAAACLHSKSVLQTQMAGYGCTL